MAKGKSSRPLSPVFLFVGDEPLLVSEAWEELVDRVFGKEIPPMSITEFEGGSAQPADVLDEVRTPSFLAEKKIVRLRNAEEMLKGGGAEGSEGEEEPAEPAPPLAGAKSGKRPSKNAREMFLDYVDNPCPSGILVLQLKSESSATKLYKAVNKLGGIVECAPPQKGFNAVEWCLQRCQSRLEQAISAETARLLVDAVGVDLTLLANELDKLAIYVGERREITPADVQALVGQNRTEQTFRIADYIVEGNATAALTHWRRLIDNDREAPFMAIGGLARVFRSLVSARQLYDMGLPEFQIIKESGAWSLRGKMSRVLGRWSTSRLESVMAELLEIDYAAKSGRGEVETAVEKFIVQAAG